MPPYVALGEKRSYNQLILHTKHAGEQRIRRRSHIPPQLHLFQEEPDQEQSESLLQQWLVTGTVEYVDSRRYTVSEGKAVVEIVSTAPYGITATLALTKGLSYNLDNHIITGSDSNKNW